jgi:hypothetical protein
MGVVFVTQAVGSKICADREKKSCPRSFGSPTFDAAGVARTPHNFCRGRDKNCEMRGAADFLLVFSVFSVINENHECDK